MGEPINPEAWRWFLQRDRGRPLPDYGHLVANRDRLFYDLPDALCHSQAGHWPPGRCRASTWTWWTNTGNRCLSGQDGYLVIKKPWPSMLRTLYKNPELYKEVYWNKLPGVYTTGDSARKDEDGYIWIVGRMDDVIKVSGYRLGTAEIESALVSHPAVAEAACIGLPHEIKGNSIKSYVVLRHGFEASDALSHELREHVGLHLSKVARPDSIEFKDKLPKTRSGKIMRRLLKALELGQPIGDTSTLED